jgi:ABC-type transport system involved in cytochrome bd biosynthesis fused ATPase/permease subunit
LDNYLDAFPEGLATILQSDGSPLSRSVSKRIILARSLACKPALLLYEDLFAELSASEKASLYKCILSGPWTLIAFTNDELLINQVDRKILLEKGSFVSTN